MIPQAPTIFCGMPMVLMILAIEVTVSLFGFLTILLGRLKKGSFLIFSNT